MTFGQLYQAFAERGICLTITKKSVKNINFRMRLGECHVSAPHFASEKAIIEAVQTRLAWAENANHKLTQRQQSVQRHSKTLWGQQMNGLDDEHEILCVYRKALHEAIPDLIAKWQPIVGRCANEVRIKKMTTRWGTCNTKDARIWLSVYLAAYPYECTEYVFVHELCHLIHANHSKAFWAEVKKAMPDYQKWHGLLRGRSDCCL